MSLEYGGLNGSGLIVDGYVIPEDVSLTFMNGKQNAVDVLTGSNKDEANFGICGPAAGLVLSLLFAVLFTGRWPRGARP